MAHASTRDYILACCCHAMSCGTSMTGEIAADCSGQSKQCHDTNYLAQPLCLLDVPWPWRFLAQGCHSHAWPALCVGLPALSDTLPWPARLRTFRPAQALLHQQSSSTASQPGQTAGRAEEEGRAQEWQLQNAPALVLFRLTAGAIAAARRHRCGSPLRKGKEFMRSDRLLGLCHLLNTHDRGMPSKLQTGWSSWVLAATGLSQLVLGFGLCFMLSQQGGDGCCKVEVHGVVMI